MSNAMNEQLCSIGDGFARDIHYKPNWALSSENTANAHGTSFEFRKITGQLIISAEVRVTGKKSSGNDSASS